MPVTLKKIAELAGVSRPAVSMLLNDPATSHLSEEKKQTVLRLVRELGYRPNYAARHLRGISGKTIGIVGSLFSVPVHAAMTDSIMHHFWKRGYQVLLGDHAHQYENELKIVSEFESRGVDGVILLNATSPAIRKQLHVPCVAASHNQDSFDVSTDFLMGGRIAGRHLLAHGHQNIGFVRYTPESGTLRCAGLREAMEEAGAHLSDAWIVDEAQGAQRIIELVRNYQVTAFFALNDYIAASLIRLLSRNSIRVPEDVAVIGFDGLAFDTLLVPTLATVAQPIDALGRACVELMLNRIDGSDRTSSPQLLAPEFIAGESCGCESVDTWEHWMSSNGLTLQSRTNWLGQRF